MRTGLVDDLDVMEVGEPDVGQAAGLLAWLDRTPDGADGWSPDGRGRHGGLSGRRRRRRRSDIN